MHSGLQTLAADLRSAIVMAADTITSYAYMHRQIFLSKLAHMNMS